MASYLTIVPYKHSSMAGIDRCRAEIALFDAHFPEQRCSLPRLTKTRPPPASSSTSSTLLSEKPIGTLLPLLIPFNITPFIPYFSSTVNLEIQIVKFQ